MCDWELISLQFTSDDEAEVLYEERHVIPVANKTDHEFDTLCWCQPTTELTTDNVTLVVHTGLH